jgi:hypothetical protein
MAPPTRGLAVRWTLREARGRYEQHGLQVGGQTGALVLPAPLQLRGCTQALAGLVMAAAARRGAPCLPVSLAGWVTSSVPAAAS